MPAKKAPRAEPSPKQKLTLKGVASIVGVSRTTMSNAFNRPEQLSKQLRGEILKKCRELGYFGPDPAARALRRRVIQEVAVVFHHDLQFIFGDQLSIEFLRGVSAELDRRGMILQLIPNLGRMDSLGTAFHTTADALIVYAEIVRELAAEVRSVSKPLVLVDTQLSGTPSVRIDDRRGASMAVEYALASKPGRLIVLRFKLDDRQRARVFERPNLPRSGSVSVERMAGCVAAAGARGWPPARIDWLEIDDWKPQSAEAPLQELLQRLAPGTRVALVGMSDRIALAALEVLRRASNIRVTAVVGFDDIPAAGIAGLTTIRQDARMKGEHAVKLLLDGGKSVTLGVELVVRET